MILWPMRLVRAPQGARLPIPKSSQGKEMEEKEEEEEEGCSESLTGHKLLQLTTRDSLWLQKDKVHGEQKAELKKDAFPTWVGKVKCMIRSQMEEFTHGNCTASFDRVSRIAHHGKQGACEDPWNVLWLFNGTRDFYLFI